MIYSNSDILFYVRSVAVVIGLEIKRLRQNLGISQTKLANSLDVRQSTVAMWEAGKNNPGYEMLLRIANFFGVGASELCGEMESTNKVPILGRVAAGPPRTATEDIVGYEEISPELAETGEFFALHINGQSMEPRMKEGDVVIVRRQPCVENGEIAIVLIGREEATCKRFYRYKEGISLVSLNPQYAPMFFSEEDLKETEIEVLGRVCELRARF